MENILKNFFQKWTIVYSGQDTDKYYKAKEILNNHDIPNKTEFVSSGGGEGGGYGFATTYHLKVKEEDAPKAYKALN